MKQVVIKNISGGPWKIKFKMDTPLEIKQKISGVLKAGKTITVFSDVSKYLNIMHLEVSKHRGVIAYREMDVASFGPPPVTKLINKSPKSTKKSSVKKVDKEVKDKSLKSKEKTKGEFKKGEEAN